MQAKDNRLLLATIGWSKEKHTTHLPEGLRRYDTRFASAGFSCRFAPQNDKKILAKTENLININYPKSQNFDEIVVFSAGFENSSVLGVHEFSSSAEKAEYRKIMTF